MASGQHWVGTWAAAPAPAEGVVGFSNQTLRMNPRVSIGGERRTAAGPTSSRAGWCNAADAPSA
jgi:hypothetical protein